MGFVLGCFKSTAAGNTLSGKHTGDTTVYRYHKRNKNPEFSVWREELQILVLHPGKQVLSSRLSNRTIHMPLSFTANLNIAHNATVKTLIKRLIIMNVLGGELHNMLPYGLWTHFFIPSNYSSSRSVCLLGAVMHWLLLVVWKGIHTNPFSGRRKNGQPAVFWDLFNSAEDIIIYCVLHAPRALQNGLTVCLW